MILLILIIVATVIYSLFNVFVSKASGQINSSISAFIFNGIGALIPLTIYFLLKNSRKASLLPTTKTGVTYSLLAGVTIGIFSIIFIRIFQKGDLTYIVPIISGGTIIMTSLIGIILFKESVSLLQIVGIILATIGIVIIAVANIYKLNI